MQKRRFTYWPFLLDPPDRPNPRPEDEYGPINDDTIAVIDVDFGSPELLVHAHLLPAPPPGCFYALVGMETVEVEERENCCVSCGCVSECAEDAKG